LARWEFLTVAEELLGPATEAARFYDGLGYAVTAEPRELGYPFAPTLRCKDHRTISGVSRWSPRARTERQFHEDPHVRRRSAASSAWSRARSAATITVRRVRVDAQCARARAQQLATRRMPRGDLAPHRGASLCNARTARARRVRPSRSRSRATSRVSCSAEGSHDVPGSPSDLATRTGRDACDEQTDGAVAQRTGPSEHIADGFRYRVRRRCSPGST
jgi:hypothetical protein